MELRSSTRIQRDLPQKKKTRKAPLKKWIRKAPVKTTWKPRNRIRVDKGLWPTFSCDTCNLIVKKETTMIKHRLIHPVLEYLTCDLCDFVCPMGKKELLPEHLREVHGRRAVVAEQLSISMETEQRKSLTKKTKELVSPKKKVVEIETPPLPGRWWLPTLCGKVCKGIWDSLGSTVAKG